MKNRILKIKKNSKMTQDAFTEKLGLSKNFVWMLEKGERIPSDRTLSDINNPFYDLIVGIMKTYQGLDNKSQELLKNLGKQLLDKQKTLKLLNI